MAQKSTQLPILRRRRAGGGASALGMLRLEPEGLAIDFTTQTAVVKDETP